MGVRRGLIRAILSQLLRSRKMSFAPYIYEVPVENRLPVQDKLISTRVGQDIRSLLMPRSFTSFELHFPLAKCVLVSATRAFRCEVITEMMPEPVQP